MIGVFLLAACGSTCPAGWATDEERVAALGALAGHPLHARVCFGPVPELGLRDPDGRFLLDADTDDRLLAARVVHLEHHVTAPSDARCVESLQREEAEAWAAELRMRDRLGAVHTDCPAVRHLGSSREVGAIEAWIATSSDPVPSQLRASHRSRCGW